MSVSKQNQLSKVDLDPVGLYARANELTGKLMEMEQASTPVIHRFSEGLYIREVHLPAGAFVIGHEHKTEHFNIMLKGRLVMVNEDGTLSNYIAPQSYSAKPGRKIAYIVEDTVWQNVFPTDENDVEKLEDALLNKSDDYKLSESRMISLKAAEFEADRQDFCEKMLKLGLPVEYVDLVSKGKADLIDFDFPVHPHCIRSSPIEGKGYFLTLFAEPGQILAPARIGDKRTPAGRYVNHSLRPNAAMKAGQDGNMYLVAIDCIDGCVGGSPGTEVTIDYEAALAVTAKMNAGEKLCQQ